MPDFQHRTSVRAHYLLAASVFTNPTERSCAGVTIAPHPRLPGVLLTATTGAQVAVIYDGHGHIEGQALTWRFNHAQLVKEHRKVFKSSSGVASADAWAVLTWHDNGPGSYKWVEADDGERALSRGRKIKSAAHEVADLVVTGQKPDVLAAIRGAASASERHAAPAEWFYPAGMARIEEFSRALYDEGALYGATLPIAILRTARSNIVQVVFRDYDDCVVFLVTLRGQSTIRTDNPGWLEALL